jgi:DNA-directed RNA polymerase subunit RPC12/RpoP
MRAAVKCLLDNRTITIEDALLLRSSAATSKHSRHRFTCLECGEELRAHKAGDNSSAHFEHLSRNPHCSHSAAPNAANTGGAAEATFDIGDIRAIEGYEIDRVLTTHARSVALVEACKARDGYKCQACGFKLMVHARYIIECHHVNPVALSGEREVSINELVCLCPTCHRIAHTRIAPLSIEEIRRARADLY